MTAIDSTYSAFVNFVIPGKNKTVLLFSVFLQKKKLRIWNDSTVCKLGSGQDFDFINVCNFLSFSLVIILV